MFRISLYLVFITLVSWLQPIQSRAALLLPGNGSGVVLGRVVDFETASPIGGAIVTAVNRDDDVEYTGVTASDGTFFLSALPPGWYTISARCNGYTETILEDYPVRIPDIAAEPAAIGLAKTGLQKLQVSPSPPQPVIRKFSRKTDTLLEASVRWDTAVNPPPAGAPASNQDRTQEGFTLINLRQRSGSLPRERAPELSSTQLLVVILDERGEQRGWTLIPDPRIIRAESPGPTGELSGQILYRSSAEFVVAIPEGLLFPILKFYKPQWTGRDFSLNAVGSVSIQ